MRREIITVSVALAVILAAFGATVLILNASLYSASGFVRGYLDSLARHDAAGALELAGTVAEGDASTEMLRSDSMGDISDIRLVSDTAGAGGVHSVEFSYLAGGVAGSSTFQVLQHGTTFGFFTQWQFAVSPLGVVQLDVQHDDDFTANGIPFNTSSQNHAVPYLVFVPGAYVFAHDSTWLTAAPVTVQTTEPGEAVPARLDIQPNDAMVAEVQSQLNTYLDQCATQQVLQPTGCPFGKGISDRVASTPSWSITGYPKATLTASSEPGRWSLTRATGTAHLKVDVQSLFDGSISTFDQDVPFAASATVGFGADGRPLLVPSG